MSPSGNHDLRLSSGVDGVCRKGRFQHSFSWPGRSRSVSASTFHQPSHHITTARICTTEVSVGGWLERLAVSWFISDMMVGDPRFAASTVGHKPDFHVTRASYALDVACLLDVFEACLAILIQSVPSLFYLDLRPHLPIEDERMQICSLLASSSTSS